MSGKIFAIGDIHGSFHKLEKLLEKLPIEKEKDKLIFMGDYINRGNQVKEVLNFIAKLKDDDYNLIPLMGNHEYLLLEYHLTNYKALLPYLRNLGVETTLASYGGASLQQMKELSFFPKEHYDFLINLIPYHETEDFIFVHAGIKTGIPLAEHKIHELCETRDSFIRAETGLRKRVVFGHTPFASPLVLADKIGIDTGAVYGNYLTALELPAFRFHHA
jgi:serine/threonine protein phosphatase 1